MACTISQSAFFFSIDKFCFMENHVDVYRVCALMLVYSTKQTKQRYHYGGTEAQFNEHKVFKRHTLCIPYTHFPFQRILLIGNCEEKRTQANHKCTQRKRK